MTLGNGRLCGLAQVRETASISFEDILTRYKADWSLAQVRETASTSFEDVLTRYRVDWSLAPNHAILVIAVA